MTTATEIHIQLRETHNDETATEPFDLEMWAEDYNGLTLHYVSQHCPFGTVLAEVGRFLDMNVR